MDLHPNWIALATVDFERKIFVREQNSIEEFQPKIKIPRNETGLTGEDARNFYLNVISSPENVTDTRSLPEYKVRTIESVVSVTEDTSKVNERLINTFLLAAQEDDVETLKHIFSKYPNVLNHTDNFGWTALMCAAKSASLHCVKFLLEQKADISIRDKTGNSALSLAKNDKRVFDIFQNLSICKYKKPNNNRRKSEMLVHCDICEANYNFSDKAEHFSSTLHVFCANKGKKMKTYYGIPESNRGYQILLKTGWNEDNGLGPEGRGHKYPIKTVHKRNRHGIGIKTDTPRVTHNPNSQTKKTNRVTNKKYKKLVQSREKFIERNLRRELS